MNSQIRIPTDLKKALSAAPKSNEKWRELTPIARRDFISWVVSAKLEETRKRRIERTCDMLVSGKKRPCCYSVVPLDLYTAINTNPKIKATWKSLTPAERRDYTDWIGGDADKVRKAASMLASGKRHP